MGNASNVLAFNASGFDAAAAHIFVTSSPANAANIALATGFAAEAPQGHVPDGGTTLALLGAGLSGLGLVRRLVKH